jgi:hypothetical protein
MTYRVQYRSGARWITLGLDCLDRHEAMAAMAMAPIGAPVRVRLVSGGRC